MISAAPPPSPEPSPGRDSSTSSTSSLRGSNAGRWTVIGMLLFGFGIVGAMWLYWDRYTRPFRPLQQAVARAYPTAKVYVVGGRAKSHLHISPNTLRIVLQQADEDFNPEKEEAASLNRAIDLYHLAERHQNLDGYQELEIHLVQPVPEQATRQWSLSLPVKDWPDLKAIPPLP